MPYPSEGIESAYKTNHIDDVRVSIDENNLRISTTFLKVYICKL